MPQKLACAMFAALASANGPGYMRAWFLDAYADMDSLNFSQYYPAPGRPLPGRNILIDVRASSVNPIDYKILLPGLHDAFPVSFPCVFGFEGAGVVKEVGPDASGALKVGDEVYFDGGNEYIGSYADIHMIPEDLVALKPASLSFEEAATLPLVGVTSMQALDKINKSMDIRGKTILILGGSGGTGTAAIQLAKNVFGAQKVITTTGTDNLDFVKSLGADQVIDYHSQNWWETIQNGTIAAVYDTVGEAGTGPRATAALEEDGVFLTIAHKGAAVGLDSNPPPNRVQIYHKMSKKNARADLDRLSSFVEAGKLKPTVSKTYALEELMQAWQESDAGHVQGKLAISHAQNATNALIV